MISLTITKISIATSVLILPFAYGDEFASAKDINLCGRELNGGSGWGRTEFSTRNAKCIGEATMNLVCLYTHPSWSVGDVRQHEYDCKGKESCVPHSQKLSPIPDAGCLVLHSPSGVKGSGDMDNHACSSGIKIGNDDIYVLSSISPDSLAWDNGIRACIVSKNGRDTPADTIFKGSPCPKTSRILKLAAHTTYQACITTAVALAKTSVGFHWNIRSPGKTYIPPRRRGLQQQGKPPLGLQQQGKPLSEMFTIVGNNTANDALRIVIGDHEIPEHV
ncbi:hypothetical protein EG328_002958 [Venturia inaequalis]|uniref:Secreted protein n=1 Tax=Venturia inaequalis TaxID=5025 RepID=A0A8H3VPF3_VENIN|nr:hypothetical protein EG328_002958 [Venturia inaequalis]KAE9994112.1 hypothetical protein EG327_001184 [Venturia inaequalis]